MPKTKHKRTLSEKTVRSTVKGIILFGIVAQLVSLSFYSESMTKQIIERADSIAIQTRMAAVRGFDTVEFSKQVMSIYDEVSKDESLITGTEEYRERFSELDTSKGSTYDQLFHMLAGVVEAQNAYDVYIAMYDRERTRIVYIVEPDEDPETRLYPGDWEPVNKNGLERFLDYDGEGCLYDIEYTKYGLLCTVGKPITDESGKLVCFMNVDISVAEVVVGMAGFFLQLTIALIAVSALVAFLQTKKIKRDLVEPINRISEASVEYVKGHQAGDTNSDYFGCLDIHTGDELEELKNTMSCMEKDISEFEINLTRITAEKERIGTELSLATKIQASMLPSIFPAFPDRSEFDIYANTDPAREVGGDFFDFFLVDNDHLCIVTADVSGKGVPAALFMMVSKTIIHGQAMLGISPAEILKNTNETLVAQNKTVMFVTVWLGILQISTGKLTCANAGHEYPAIRRYPGRYELLKDKHGFVIGGLDGVDYNEYEFELAPGDRVFLYTDGVPEASDAQKNMFGTDRMLESLNSRPDVTLTELIAGVRNDLNSFVGDEEQFDDITMVCLEYKGIK